MAHLDGETQNKSDLLYRIRHSMAHVMAQAVKRLFPEVKLGFGPPTDTGFYYDFDFGDAEVHETDFKRIEKEMRRIVNARQIFERSECDSAAAIEQAGALQEPLKELQIQNLMERGVSSFSFYKNDSFIDLCEGPHVETTGDLSGRAFKLDRLAGAYWLGSEKNAMLTRIYALCFTDDATLKAYLERRKRAEQRDHKKLGRELDLFTISDEVGKGLILWMPHGTVIRDEIENYAKEMEFKWNYQRVSTPHITKAGLFLKSQHLPAYEDSMFPPMTLEEEGTVKERFYLKPMNCPFHHTIYAARPRSYRDLPLRLAEYGTCYRFEQSGELSGLIRVRCMTMNDAHIYCGEDSLAEEIQSIMQMYQDFYKTFGLTEYTYRLSTRGADEDHKFKGDPALWVKAEKYLEEALKGLDLPYDLGEGEAAFYGPKIDIQFKNLMGREETVSTIQVDFLGPQNFNLEFINKEGKEEQPVIIHRAPLSTHERFISFLIEYYGGAFPLWMAPVQVVVIPVAPPFQEAGIELQKELHALQIRAVTDVSDNSFSKKIRTHLKRKVPMLLILGQKEVENGTVTLRRYGTDEQKNLSKGDWLELIQQEIRDRVLTTPLLQNL